MMEHVLNTNPSNHLTVDRTLPAILSPKVVLWFALLAAFLSAESWILGPYSYVPLHDNGDSQVPVFYTLLRSMQQYGLLHWNPHHLGGIDETVTYNIFQLETPFFLLFPIWAAAGSILFIQHFLGGLSMYAYCRNRFSMAPTAAVIAGVAYTAPISIMFGSLSPHQWWWNNFFEYRIAWGFAEPALPLFILLIDYASSAKDISRNLVFGTIIGALLGVSMFIVAFWHYTVIVILMCILFLGRGPWLNRLAVFTAVAIVSAIPQLRAIIGSTYLYAGSHRVLTDLPPAAASWSTVIHDVVTGVLTLGFDSFYGLYFRIFPVSFIVIGTAIILSIYRRLPDIRTMCLICVFYLCFQTTVSLSDSYKAILGLLSAPVIFYRLNTWYLWQIGTKFILVLGFGYATHLMLLICPIRFKSSCHAVIVVVVAAPIAYSTLDYLWTDLALWAQSGSAYANYNSPQMRQLGSIAGNDTPYRVATIANYYPVPIEPNFVNPLGFEGIDGHENLIPLRFGRYLLTIIEGERATYLDQFVHSHVGTIYDDKPIVSNRAYILYKEGPIKDSVNLDLLAFGNVRYILSPIKQDDSRLRLVLEPHPESWNWETAPAVARFIRGAVGIMQKINIGRLAPGANASYHYHLNLIVNNLPTNFGGRELYIYENTLWAPRAFLVSETEVHAPNDVWDVLSRRSLSELMAKAIVEAPIMPPLGGEATGVQSAPLRFTRYEPEHLEIEGVASRASLVVITNSYSPYWKPRVNGNAETALPAYGAFTAVRVSAGHFAIDLRYQPPTLLSRLGLAGENR